MSDFPFLSCPLIASDQEDFPVRLTERAYRFFTSGWNAVPFFRPFKYLGCSWDEEQDGPDCTYEKKYDPERHLLAQFRKLRVVVPKQDADVLDGFALDFGYWPLCGAGTLWLYPFERYNGASNPGLLPVSDELLCELHPELFAAFRPVARPPEEFGDSASRQFARDRIAARAYGGDTRAALVVQTQPLIVAAYASDFDNVLLLRFPDAYSEEAVRHFGLRPGRRLVTVNYFGSEGETASELVTDTPLTNWKNFQPIIGEFVSDNQGRLAELHANIDEAEWDRCAQLASTRLRAGVPFRDGRPLLSFVAPEWRDQIRYPYAQYVPTT